MLLTVLLRVTMGILFSEHAKNAFRVVQFIPLVIIPKVLLSGIIFETDALPKLSRWIATAMPPTHASNILKKILSKGESVAAIGGDYLALGGDRVHFSELPRRSTRKVKGYQPARNSRTAGYDRQSIRNAICNSKGGLFCLAGSLVITAAAHWPTRARWQSSISWTFRCYFINF